MLHKDFEIVFISHDKPDFLIMEVKKLGIKLLTVATKDYPQPDKRIDKDEIPYDMDEFVLGNEIVVLDGYWFGENFQKRIKNIGSQLVVIDDLKLGHTYADLLINSLPSAETKDFKAQLYTKFALGLNYVLLRPAFLNSAQRLSLDTDKRFDINSVLICFGGSDVKGLTVKTMKEVLSFKQFSRICIVIGHSFDHIEELEKLADSRVEIHQSINDEDFVELLGKVGLVIVPASGVMLESLASHKVVIAGMYADNQKKQLNEFVEMDAIVSAGCFSRIEIRDAINVSLVKKRPPNKVIDGKSGERILKLFHNF